MEKRQAEWRKQLSLFKLSCSEVRIVSLFLFIVQLSSGQASEFRAMMSW